MTVTHYQPTGAGPFPAVLYAHANRVLHLETTREMYGRALLGLPPSSPVI